MAVLVALVLITTLARLKPKNTRTFSKISDIVYRFGDVRLDKSAKTIEFPAEVVKSSGYADFLIYLKSYKWLEKTCAVVSAAKLEDLQNAIAYFDWKLWDTLYTDKAGPAVKLPEIYIQSGGIAVNADKFVKTENEKLEIKDLVFLGSPYFDQVVFRHDEIVDCGQCPAFKLEEKSVRKQFVRRSGKSGYELDPKMMPVLGKKVKVIIKLPPS